MPHMIVWVIYFEITYKNGTDIIRILVQSELSVLPVTCTQMIAYTEFVSRQGIPWRSKDEDSTDASCCVKDGDPWSAKQHHCKSDAKEDHQLSPGGPSNRWKSSGPNQLKWIALGRGHHRVWRPIHWRAIKECSTVINRDWPVNH